jgi:hypothetical protein
MYVYILIMEDKNVLKIGEIVELLKGVSGSDRLEKESAISWDGRNLIIRIPREVTDILKINEKNRFKKNFKFIIDQKEGKRIQLFEITERTKPIKEKTKNASINKK